METTCEIVRIGDTGPAKGEARPVVSHQSALWLWREGWTPARRLGDAEVRQRLETPVRNADVCRLREAVSYPEELPVHILCGSQGARRRLRLAQCHVVPAACSLPVPLVEAASPQGDKTVAAVAPEVSWAQVALKAGVAVARELAWELTGTYRADPRAPFGLDERPPLATVASLMDAAVLLRGGRYPMHVRRMLNGVWDRAASPMEGRLACLMTLPRRCGGYGIPIPDINVSLELEPEEASLVGSRAIVPDFFWKDAGLALEYDSDAVHGSDVVADHDARKRRVYEARGITGLSLTRQQVMDPVACDTFMDDVRRRLGMDSELPLAYVYRRRARLRHELFGWRELDVLAPEETQGAEEAQGACCPSPA
ncbi:hypothetical protein AAK967_07695 [Atopobiaceae bacterium 24-176]